MCPQHCILCVHPGCLTLLQPRMGSQQGSSAPWAGRNIPGATTVTFSELTCLRLCLHPDPEHPSGPCSCVEQSQALTEDKADQTSMSLSARTPQPQNMGLSPLLNLSFLSCCFAYTSLHYCYVKSLWLQSPGQAAVKQKPPQQWSGFPLALFLDSWGKAEEGGN